MRGNGSPIPSRAVTSRCTPVYTPVEYLITFTAEGKIVWAGTYTVEDEGVEEPEVPQKRGYEGRWRDYTLLPGGVAVSAVYTPIEYTISFIADGKTVAERKFTVEDEDALLPPALPEKVGHSGAWEEFSFDYADLEVHAVYTPLSYAVAATGGEGQGSVEGGGVYPFGTRAVLRATPYPGYVFSGWYRGNALISEEAEYAFSVPAEDTAYTAKFAVREDMLPFTFVSEADSCTVTGRVGEDADKVVLPDCVTAVGYDAFFASDVREVVLPDSVTVIGDSAFYACKQLRKVTVGKGLHFFRYGAFEGCEGIEEVHISDLSAWCSAVFFDEHSNPLSYGARLYLNGEETVELNLQGIEKIEDRTFENCPSPASVSLGEGAEEIGRYAFAGCLSLESVRFPASLTSIGAGAFRGCTALDGESFPAKLESIGGEAFRNCGAWTVGDIPDSVTYVGAYAFEGCASLGALSPARRRQSRLRRRPGVRGLPGTLLRLRRRLPRPSGKRRLRRVLRPAGSAHLRPLLLVRERICQPLRQSALRRGEAALKRRGGRRSSPAGVGRDGRRPRLLRLYESGRRLPARRRPHGGGGVRALRVPPLRLLRRRRRVRRKPRLRGVRRSDLRRLREGGSLVCPPVRLLRGGGRAPPRRGGVRPRPRGGVADGGVLRPLLEEVIFPGSRFFRKKG